MQSFHPNPVPLPHTTFPHFLLYSVKMFWMTILMMIVAWVLLLHPCSQDILFIAQNPQITSPQWALKSIQCTAPSVLTSSIWARQNSNQIKSNQMEETSRGAKEEGSSTSLAAEILCGLISIDKGNCLKSKLLSNMCSALKVTRSLFET